MKKPGIIQKSFRALIESGKNENINYPCLFLVEMGEIDINGSFTWVSGHILDEKNKKVGGKILIKFPNLEEK